MAKFVLDFFPGGGTERATPLRPLKLPRSLETEIATAVDSVGGLTEEERVELTKETIHYADGRWQNLRYRRQGQTLLPVDDNPFPVAEMLDAHEKLALRVLADMVEHARGNARARVEYKQRQRLVGVCPHCRCSHCET